MKINAATHCLHGKKRRDLPIYQAGILECKNRFLIDHFKIVNTRSYQRLAHKTQVFNPQHKQQARNRLMHSGEVEALSMLISEALNLNTGMCLAIASGHDTGHGPFGHLFERVISNLSSKKFKHEFFSVILLDTVENMGMGLNLHWETLKGISRHSRGGGNINGDANDLSEFNVVTIADKISYTFGDLEDCLRLKYINRNQVPSVVNHLGEDRRSQIAACYNAVVSESKKEGKVQFQNSFEYNCFVSLREWMYENVYLVLDKQKNRRINSVYLSKTYEKAVKYCIKNPDLSPEFIVAIMTDEECKQIARSSKKIEDHRHLECYKMFKYCKKRGYQEIDILIDLLNTAKYSNLNT